MPNVLNRNLRDVAEIVMGQSPAGEECNRQGIGLPLLNGPTEFGPHHPYPTQFTTDPKRRSEPRDLLFCVRGSTTGRMNWSDQCYAIGRGVAAIRHKHDLRLQPLVRAVIEHNLPHLLQIATGSTFPNVSSSQLGGVDFPPLAPEDELPTAALLAALDNKIDLNRRMNETLEATARAIFKDWYVDFGPTRAKMEGRAPYLTPDVWALFPGRLDDDGKPEGWTAEKLGAFADLQNGYAFKSADWQSEGIPVIKIGSVKPGFVDLGQVSFISSNLAAARSQFQLSVGDVVVGLTGYVGETGRVPPTDKLPLLNQRVGRFLPRAGLHSFVYACVRDPDFKLHAEMNAHGSAQANVSTKDLLDYPVNVGDRGLLQAFENVAGPLLLKSLNNAGEAECLAATRDLLLPKLMSGEIRVRDAEKVAGAVL